MERNTEIRKHLPLKDSDGNVNEYQFIFFKVRYNHFRDTSTAIDLEVRDREEFAECECVLCLPDSYSDDGDETPFVLSFHGSGGRVCEELNLVGGIKYCPDCVKAGYAVLDVCGSEPHGITMGCPEHLFAAYKAYRYAIKHFNLSHDVLLSGASMGGHTAINFANTFPGIVRAIGIFYPGLNLDRVSVNGHECAGIWDRSKTKREDVPSLRDRIVEIYRFPTNEWYELNTVGFNPYRARSFINSDGERVVIPPCPIKIWQGTADKSVDPVMAEEFVNSVRRSGSYIEFHLLDGIGHKPSPIMKKEQVMWFNRFI
ncbi:MAG: alpha/beta hydrolase [Clostridia bacterium]|nr:alpha/beta hydrolase [Clostridia bacterium]